MKQHETKLVRLLAKYTLIIMLLGLFMESQRTALSAEKSPQITTVSLTAAQKKVLLGVTTWKITATHNYPHEASSEGIPIAADCQRLLQDAGWVVVSDEATAVDALLAIVINGEAKWSSYYGSPSTRYSGAKVDISATVSVNGKELIRFQTVHGDQHCPYSIWGGYVKPQQAPFDNAYEKCNSFFTQWFSLIRGCKGPEGVLQALSDNELDSWIRRCGYTFVSYSGDRQFVPLLVNLLMTQGERYYLSTELAQSLGSLGDERAVESLCANLLSEDGSIWYAAAVALGKLGSPKAIPALRTALLADADMRNIRGRSDVAAALDNLGWHPENVQETIFYFFAKDQHDEVVKIGSKAVDVLIGCLSHKDSQLRSFSVKALGEIGDSVAVKPLCGIVLTDESSSLRTEAAKALARIKGEDVESCLSQALLTDNSSNVRSAAAKSLAEVSRTGALSFLCQAILADNDKNVVAVIAETLGQIGDPAATQSLCQVLEHENSNVRAKAAEALKAIRDPNAAGPLKARLEKEEDEDVRDLLLEAIREIGVQVEDLSIENRLRFLAGNNDWEKIRDFLEEYPTDRVIETLKIEQSLVRRTAKYVLTKRTGKYDLGEDYDAWKKWWDEEGKRKMLPGEVNELAKKTIGSKSSKSTKIVRAKEIRASHILIATAKLDEKGKANAKARIEELLRKIRSGASFEELARKHSDCPSKVNGGDLGYFKRGKMVKEFEDTAFALEIGEISDVVETIFGYHIIKVTDRKGGE